MADTQSTMATAVDAITDLSELIDVLASRDRVSGLTHSLYRYPARFSPNFARAAILNFTAPGDFVLDPFVGGGTTLVECLALGRKGVGSDLNQLAVFVARAKTTLLTDHEARRLTMWAERLDRVTTKRWHSRLPSPDSRELDSRVPWNIRRSLHLALDSASELKNRRVQRMARASLLRLGQWALDGKKGVPTRRAFLLRHAAIVLDVIQGSLELAARATTSFSNDRRYAERQRRIVHSPAELLLASATVPTEWGAPRLVLTSPPYHGLHILYHRWQVQGRRETNAPYWLSGCEDGQPARYYTFGSRLRLGDPTVKPEYFDHTFRSYKALRGLCDERTLVVQLVGFSNPRVQLPLYREAMKEAGFIEAGGRKRTVSRDVPNRKWYWEAVERCDESEREFLLIHRVAP